jgi:hypothetical protein
MEYWSQISSRYDYNPIGIISLLKKRRIFKDKKQKNKEIEGKESSNEEFVDYYQKYNNEDENDLKNENEYCCDENKNDEGNESGYEDDNESD